MLRFLASLYPLSPQRGRPTLQLLPSNCLFYMLMPHVLAWLQVWDPVTGKLKKDLTYQAEELFMMHEEAVLALAFNRESSVLVSGGLGGWRTALASLMSV
jgi:hypothetical protein